MNWDSFFETGESVTADEARQFMASGESDRYQLLDVRQPKEYEQAHIPGAILIPLPELAARHQELDKGKPTIVYCRSGVRSKAACQILNLAGAAHVFNMTGGILDWNGEQADGPEAAGLEFFLSGDYPSTFAMAYQMEAGLREFYRTLADRAETEEEKETLNQLALFEDGHMALLKNRHREFADQLPEKERQEIIEGGLDLEQMIAVFGPEMTSPERIIQLGMKFEAQAFDLYSRLARKHHGTEISRFFREMANEEQNHLQRLARKLETTV